MAPCCGDGDGKRDTNGGWDGDGDGDEDGDGDGGEEGGGDDGGDGYMEMAMAMAMAMMTQRRRHFISAKMLTFCDNSRHIDTISNGVLIMRM